MSNIQIRPQDPVQKLKTVEQLVSMRAGEIEAMAQGAISAEVLSSAALNSIRKSKEKLLQCSHVSWLSALMQCAATGLVPDTPSQECHLIPFGNTVTWIAGYRGLARLVRQSPEVAQVEARVVHAKDEFSYELGLEPKLAHIPYSGADDPGPLTHVYSIARFHKAPPQFEVMSFDQVERIRKGSRNGNSGPWKDHFDEMARKTVFRRMFKWLPQQSASAALAMELDNLAAAGEDQPIHAAVPSDWTEEPDDRSATDKLAGQIAPEEPAKGEGEPDDVTAEAVTAFRDEHKADLPSEILAEMTNDDIASMTALGRRQAMDAMQEALKGAAA